MKVLIHVPRFPLPFSQVDIEKVIDAASAAAHEAGGWSKLQVFLIGNPKHKSTIFDRLKGLLREDALHSLILQPEGYYRLGD